MKEVGTAVNLYKTHEELTTFTKVLQKYKLTKNCYLHQDI
jgi:hypothetical protein